MKAMRLLLLILLTGAFGYLLCAKFPPSQPVAPDYSRDIKRLDDEVDRVKALADEQARQAMQAVREAQGEATKLRVGAAEEVQAVKTDAQKVIDGLREELATLQKQVAENVEGVQQAKAAAVDAKAAAGDAKTVAGEAKAKAAAAAPVEAVEGLQKRVGEVETKQAAPPPATAPPAVVIPPAPAPSAKPAKPISMLHDRTLYLTGEACVHCRNLERFDFPKLLAAGVTIGNGTDSRLQTVDVNSDEGRRYMEDLGLYREKDFGLPFFVRLIDGKPARTLKGRHSVDTLLQFITQAVPAPGASVRPVTPAPTKPKPAPGTGTKDA